MDLWSSVEKTKAARDAQRESMKRSKTRSDPAQGALAQVGSHGHPAAPCGPGNKLKPYSCLVRPRCRAAQRRGTGMLAQALKVLVRMLLFEPVPRAACGHAPPTLQLAATCCAAAAASQGLEPPGRHVWCLSWCSTAQAPMLSGPGSRSCAGWHEALTGPLVQALPLRATTSHRPS